jgi:small acid-soluble spore protein F (minor alpha/beta-type SASP)
MCDNTSYGGVFMSRHHNLMSDELKNELAKELGVDDIVAREGWGGVPSRQCGNLVAAAIQYAEKSLHEHQES